MQRVVPDRAALEIAHRALLTDARRHMQRRSRVDVKKLQANDAD